MFACLEREKKGRSRMSVKYRRGAASWGRERFGRGTDLMVGLFFFLFFKAKGSRERDG